MIVSLMAAELFVLSLLIFIALAGTIAVAMLPRRGAEQVRIHV